MHYKNTKKINVVQIDFEKFGLFYTEFSFLNCFFFVHDFLNFYHVCENYF